MELKNKYVILLLTNRDSDNIGDQVIENSDIGLLHALMRNLGFSKSEYQISSRSASIITKKYMKTRDPLLLQPIICSFQVLVKDRDVIFCT